jgi:hypothetical protein
MITDMIITMIMGTGITTITVITITVITITTMTSGRPFRPTPGRVGRGANLICPRARRIARLCSRGFASNAGAFHAWARRCVIPVEGMTHLSRAFAHPTPLALFARKEAKAASFEFRR